MSKTKPEWGQIRVPRSFAEWLRKESEREGRFMYYILETAVAKGLGGKRPWEK